ncbi:MAG: hypothetical protein P8O93_04415 [Flavobacteriaceae bacterium]|jgi:hypothetical protein|nr:hypothetical protein [Flavobacteriaceae bacterium]MDG1962019.1 hypothetical protein [Flavobacteriaceae bacterium]
MASKKNLKKDINYVLGDIIEAVYIWEATHPEKGTKDSEKVIDEAIAVFDDLIQKLNDRKAENKKQHFTSIHQELESKGRGLIEKINAL